jgi:hypothetical protein
MCKYLNIMTIQQYSGPILFVAIRSFSYNLLKYLANP